MSTTLLRFPDVEQQEKEVVTTYYPERSCSCGWRTCNRLELTDFMDLGEVKMGTVLWRGEEGGPTTLENTMNQLAHYHDDHHYRHGRTMRRLPGRKDYQAGPGMAFGTAGPTQQPRNEPLCLGAGSSWWQKQCWIMRTGFQCSLCASSTPQV